MNNDWKGSELVLEQLEDAIRAARLYYVDNFILEHVRKVISTEQERESHVPE